MLQPRHEIKVDKLFCLVFCAMIPYGYMVHYEKNIMWGISNVNKCGHFVFQNAMQVLTLCKHSSDYITNMGKGFLCVGENVFIEAPSNLRVVVP